MLHMKKGSLAELLREAEVGYTCAMFFVVTVVVEGVLMREAS